MENSKQVPENISGLSRPEMIHIFFSRSQLNYTVLGRELGLTPSGVRSLMLGETISKMRHDQLVKAGVPAEVLPVIENKRLGRKPK